MRTSLSRRDYLEWYRRMLIIRFFEEKVEILFSRGEIHGTAHSCSGQEAVAVGACAALRRADWITSTHRGHGHLIARGGDPCRMMAELFGKVTGYSQGRGGSQLMGDRRLGFLGSNGITGGGIPFATGVALSLKRRGAGGIVACFFGDGAANQGAFHESLNMAAIWRLPLVLICENNRYAMSMPVEKSMAIRTIADRALSYGITGQVVDGNDPQAVWEAVRAARKRACAGEGPTLLECKTYRLAGHSRGDPRVYRTREEEAAWRQRDPIRRFRAWLRQHRMPTDAQEATIRAQARRMIAEAVRFARTSPYPSPQTLAEGVFA